MSETVVSRLPGACYFPRETLNSFKADLVTVLLACSQSTLKLVGREEERCRGYLRVGGRPGVGLSSCLPHRSLPESQRSFCSRRPCPRILIHAGLWALLLECHPQGQQSWFQVRLYPGAKQVDPSLLVLLFMALFSQDGLSFSVLALPGLSLRFQGDCSQLPGPLGVGENGLVPAFLARARSLRLIGPTWVT